MITAKDKLLGVMGGTAPVVSAPKAEEPKAEQKTVEVPPSALQQVAVAVDIDKVITLTELGWTKAEIAKMCGISL